jgi:hypothetical protein
VSFFGSLENMQMIRSANAFVLGFKSCGFSLITLAFSLQPFCPDPHPSGFDGILRRNAADANAKC